MLEELRCVGSALGAESTFLSCVECCMFFLNNTTSFIDYLTIMSLQICARMQFGAQPRDTTPESSQDLARKWAGTFAPRYTWTVAKPASLICGVSIIFCIVFFTVYSKCTVFLVYFAQKLWGRPTPQLVHRSATDGN